MSDWVNDLYIAIEYNGMDTGPTKSDINPMTSLDNCWGCSASDKHTILSKS